MIKDQHHLGTMSCKTDGKITVGTPCTVEVTYTVGLYGIDDRGSILIVRHGVTDWQPPQFDKPADLGYTTASTDGDAKLQISIADGIRPYEDAIRIKVVDGCLKEGDRVTLVLGDKAYGSLGSVSQTYAENEHEYRVMIDPFGANRYERIPDYETFQVHAGKCVEIGLVLPSTISVDEKFDIKLRLLDDYGNPCFDFDGVVELDAPEGLLFDDNLIRITEADKGCRKVKAKVGKEGEYRLKAFIKELKLSTISNVSKTVSDDDYKLYWGDMHGQNRVAAGIGSMDDYFTFARDVAAIDFAGWQGNDFEVSDKDWQEVIDSTKQYHDPYAFITFLGYEWSGVTSGGGDHNIYYLNDDEKIYRTCKWLVTEDAVSDGTDRYPISELWKEFEGRQDVMAIPHVGGRHGNFDYYNPELIKLIEIHSHHGTFEWYIEEAMKRQMKVGFVATSDDHTSRLGLSYPMGAHVDTVGASFDVKSGLTAVYSKDLTRESIWEALKNRRCYATTCSRIILDYDIDGHKMGEEISIDEIPQMNIDVRGNAPIDYIEIRNGNDVIERIQNYPVSNKINRKRVKIVWSGVRTKFRKKSVSWDGTIFVKGGKILETHEYSFDRKVDGIISENSHIVRYRSQTSGDEDGIILDLLIEDNCSILIDNPEIQVEVKVSDIGSDPIVYKIGPENRKIVFSLESDDIGNVDSNNYNFTYSFQDEKIKDGLNSYFVKVVQKDGHMAWGSPIFVNCNK